MTDLALLRAEMAPPLSAARNWLAAVAIGPGAWLDTSLNGEAPTPLLRPLRASPTQLLRAAPFNFCPQSEIWPSANLAAASTIGHALARVGAMTMGSNINRHIKFARILINLAYLR